LTLAQRTGTVASMPDDENKLDPLALRVAHRAKPHPTGERDNPIAGNYAPSCGHGADAVNLGSTFPPCSECLKAVTWTLVAPARPPEA
jgi:hypothetical protein